MPPELMQLLIQAMMQQGGEGGGLEQELAQHDALGPEAYAQHIQTNTLGERGQLADQGMRGQLGLLGQQMGHAQQMSQPVGKDYGTVGGNIAGGLGDLARQLGGGIRMHQLGEQQQGALQAGQAAQSGLLDKMDTSNQAVGNARYEAMRKFLAQKQAQQQPAAPQAGASFGLPGLTLGPSLFGG